MRFNGQKAVLGTTGEVEAPAGNVITYIVPLGYGALAQLKAHSGVGGDFAVDGVYTPATDANAATVPGPMGGMYSKIKLHSTSPVGVIIFWEDINAL